MNTLDICQLILAGTLLVLVFVAGMCVGVKLCARAVK